MLTTKKTEPNQKESTWLDQKNKLKNSFSQLTDADLNYTEANKSEMFKKLQTKLGKTEKELQAVIDK